MPTDNHLINGVLYAKISEENYTLKRVAPSSRLSGLVETFWSVKWDLCGQKSHIQQNIPDPCVHMVFEMKRSRVVGVVTKRFTQKLTNKGNIFGIKFRAGGFYPIFKSPVSMFSDTDLSMGKIFGSDSDILIERVLDTVDVESQVSIAEKFLAPFIPNSNEIVDRLGQIISGIEQDTSITRIDHLVEKFALSPRSLQRLFNNYVGVSPKWVIRKYRIHEVLSRLENGERDWQDLITKLDYFDQAHFIRDFKDMIGITPTDYISRLEVIDREGQF